MSKASHIFQSTSILGIVYDLDGTIIDSTHIHEAAWRAAGKTHGIEITPQFIEYQKGRTNEEAAKYLLTPIKKVKLLQDFVITKMDYANQHADESHYFEDFTRAYENLCLRGIPVWVCTTSPMQFCLNVYSKFPQLKALSDRTIWREMYQNGKGEGLIQAFKNMNIEPKDGVYVGDSPNDWKAAKEVGCSFICYRNIAIERHWELLSLLP
jgi:beta-phosphoglucomutase-like phosphatase (HAD superfamily)